MKQSTENLEGQYAPWSEDEEGEGQPMTEQEAAAAAKKVAEMRARDRNTIDPEQQDKLQYAPDQRREELLRDIKARHPDLSDEEILEALEEWGE